MQLLQVKSFFILEVTLCVLWHVEVDGRTSIQVAVGCYRDRSGSGRAMPDLLASYRKNGLVWSNLDETVIQKCRKEAEERGFKCFGIQFYGECWSGLNACDTYDIYGRSDECFCTSDVSLNNTFPKYQLTENCRGPVGGRWANFVYRLRERL